jgi:N-acetylmuramate 1-kinase
MQAQALVHQTRLRFPRLAESEIRIEPVLKGGSDRKFYRISVGDERSLILVKYGHQRAENSHYVEIARFLASIGIQVPEFYHHDASEGLIWMQDLGVRDLYSYRHESWDVLFNFYKKALDQAVLLHTEAMNALAHRALVLQTEFNADLYRWEQNYFFENCLGRYFRIHSDKVAGRCNSSRLKTIASSLAQLPRVLVHRDFQSQNIMIFNERAFLIDFQGLRPGLAHYDVASLVYDPYVALTRDDRQNLINYYLAKLMLAGVPAGDNFAEVLDWCAMQRLMQALGAYGYLGLVKRHEQFLNHIPAAMKSLRELLNRIDGLDDLLQLLSELPNAWEGEAST